MVLINPLITFLISVWLQNYKDLFRQFFLLNINREIWLRIQSRSLNTNSDIHILAYTHIWFGVSDGRMLLVLVSIYFTNLTYSILSYPTLTSITNQSQNISRLQSNYPWVLIAKPTHNGWHRDWKQRTHSIIESLQRVNTTSRGSVEITPCCYH